MKFRNVPSIPGFVAIFEPISAAMLVHCTNNPNFQVADADQRIFWARMAEEIQALDGPQILIEQCETLARQGFLKAVGTYA